MSKRAEEAQASAILPESIISYAKEHAVLSGLVYREGVKFGYEQAEKDTIERAIEWLFSNVHDYLYCCVELKAAGIDQDFFADFKEAMEEE